MQNFINQVEWFEQYIFTCAVYSDQTIFTTWAPPNVGHISLKFEMILAQPYQSVYCLLGTYNLNTQKWQATIIHFM